MPPGFLDAFADAWLRDRARRTWLAEDPRGRPLGVIHGTRVQKLPSTHRLADAWFHVSLLYVAQDVRGHGVGELLLRALLDWARSDGVTRVQLNAVPEARTFFQALSYTDQREYLKPIEQAKRPETRRARIERTLAMLREGKKPG